MNNFQPYSNKTVSGGNEVPHRFVGHNITTFLGIYQIFGLKLQKHTKETVFFTMRLKRIKRYNKAKICDELHHGFLDEEAVEHVKDTVGIACVALKVCEPWAK